MTSSPLPAPIDGAAELARLGSILAQQQADLAALHRHQAEALTAFFDLANVISSSRPQPTTASPEGQRTLSVREAADALGIGETTARHLVRQGDLPSIRIRRRVLVPWAGVERLLAVAGEGTIPTPIASRRRAG